MDSRMNKYRNNNESMSRVSRNEELYKEINNSDLDNFSVRSNATIIGNQEQDIDVEKIKRILDNKYKETAKRKSIRLEPREDFSPRITEKTKEYDLNSFLANARKDNDESYEEARAKKLRDTQFDILNNLHIGENDSVNNTSEKTAEEDNSDKDLMNLINTITINEVKVKEQEEVKTSKEEYDDLTPDSPLDILEDLKGSGNTEVYEGLKEEIKKVEETSPVLKDINEVKDDVDKSFFTSSNAIKENDFEDDFLEEDKMSIWLKLLIALLIIGFIAGIVVFILKK